MMPDLRGKKVLDLGCGFGEHCRRYIEEGADQVTGLDISKKMLAFHYVEDFSGIVKNIYKILREGGTFIFSQENPLCTCHSGGDRWTRNEKGEKIYVNLANYGAEGERESVWFVDHVKKYHRTFSTIVNTLIEAGFTIEKMIEPLPTERMLEEYPEYGDLLHKPDFLLVKAKRNDAHDFTEADR